MHWIDYRIYFVILFERIIIFIIEGCIQWTFIFYFLRNNAKVINKLRIFISISFHRYLKKRKYYSPI